MRKSQRRKSPPKNIPTKYKFNTNPSVKGYDCIYWVGKKLVEKYYQLAQKSQKLQEFFEILYKEILTPTLFRKRMNNIGL